ncbi:hypothetical protein [Vibrio salinus]|uniref:hypothetical protein n=1 Tax=Vibrio salinus TaxID=2899784 RepID=UPI001E4E9502|nr:hypothetical protein [Vibrio salinus]MCE0493078.1 hypothetical protein [Vibrio salinus]
MSDEERKQNEPVSAVSASDSSVISTNDSFVSQQCRFVTSLAEDYEATFWNIFID